MAKRIIIFAVFLAAMLCARADTFFRSDFYLIYDRQLEVWTEPQFKNSYFYVNDNYTKLYANGNAVYYLTDPQLDRNDSGGGEHVTYSAVSDKGTRCLVTFRISRDGDGQILITFSDYTFVYSIAPK